MRQLICSVAMVLAAAGIAADQKVLDIRPEKTTDETPSSVTWENANDAKLSAQTSSEVLASLVADKDAATALLNQVQSAYKTDPLVACQIAAVSQWVMMPDAWYCLFWDGEHAAGRKVWVQALLQRAETSPDSYIKEFCLDQLRWCGYDCPCVINRIRTIGSASGDKAVADMSAIVIRELQQN